MGDVWYKKLGLNKKGCQSMLIFFALPTVTYPQCPLLIVLYINHRQLSCSGYMCVVCDTSSVAVDRQRELSALSSRQKCFRNGAGFKCRPRYGANK